MKRFYCDCGSQVFFDNQACLNCGASLGFDPASMDMVALHDRGDGLLAARDGDGEFRLCDNGVHYDVCNWLRPAGSDNALCFACQFNRTIPDLSFTENRNRWRVLEEAKKRLFFTLLRLGVPLENGWQNPRQGLLLDFLEDERTAPGVFPESFVTTGYLGGVITINTLEADLVARAATQEMLNERYRTVLGHLRHESGHYYWSIVDPDPELRAVFKVHFGDESADYRGALEIHYREGPLPDWRNYYISSYAAAHPSEDWAESWGHYLHIYDALETAAAHEMIPWSPAAMDMKERIAEWRKLSITLNEMNRSIGLGDAYPFVINDMVEAKLGFVDMVIRRLQIQR